MKLVKLYETKEFPEDVLNIFMVQYDLYEELTSYKVGYLTQYVEELGEEEFTEEFPEAAKKTDLWFLENGAKSGEVVYIKHDDSWFN